ncbi:Flp pilus assembly complex ATPase component TadA (plasmid) [Paenibacillus sonchi]|uniref:Flp pilus assembly complex ATPase component TadA n=1 Tax=Paenibacillus sonchi TaxID=373687 RepID=A0A974SHG3_9BACL|nr:ATPase, T2SS/T4P/T4SS family [Paenibacillus sonchi]QQZ64645.1 Flp pilus assembly complex ATPase component TadA [Paenibacillus sonchi]
MTIVKSPISFKQDHIPQVNEPFSLKKQLHKNRKPSNEDFDSYYQRMKEQMDQELRSEDDTYFQINAGALLGEATSVAYFINEIEKYVRKNPFGGAVPSAYSNITEALFQEWKGFGPACHWLSNKDYAESTGLQIIGRKIFYNRNGGFVPYPYDMPSLERVEQLKRSLLRSDGMLQLNKDNPSVEFKIDDPLWPGRFIRIAIWVSPRVWEGYTTISMRRQVVEFLTLDDQAGTGAIPKEAVAMLRAFLKTYRNRIIAGPVESGKSTYANTEVGEQLLAATKCLGLVMIEKHPESTLPHVINGHRIIPIQASNEELMEVGIESLRHDPNIIFMTEMRFNEWEFYLWSGEKGYDGIIGTFHTVDPEDIPYQGAFAVSTRVGGSLKGHLMSALKACEIVYIFGSREDGTKRLMRVSEVYYDAKKNSVFACDLMRYDKEMDSWTYHDQLTPDILQKMNNKNKAATQEFISLLSQLAKKKPMTNPIKESMKSKMVLNEVL